jgi:hypothetical protein
VGVTEQIAGARKVAVAIGLTGALLVWALSPNRIDSDAAVATAEDYLDQRADDAALSLDGRTWTVSAGGEQVIVDAQTGEPLEFVFE